MTTQPPTHQALAIAGASVIQGEAMTTPTGIPITDCGTCNRRHPITRQHCPTCGLATLYNHQSCGWRP